MASKTPEEKRAYNLSYYQANQEKLREARRAYYQTHREETRAYLERTKEARREWQREYDREHRSKSYKATHEWLRLNYPKSGACVECGKLGKTEWAFQRHPEPHTRDIADYREMCPSCHKRFDLSG